MDMKQLLDKLRPSSPLFIKREVWTISTKDGKPTFYLKEIFVKK